VQNTKSTTERTSKEKNDEIEKLKDQIRDGLSEEKLQNTIEEYENKLKEVQKEYEEAIEKLHIEYNERIRVNIYLVRKRRLLENGTRVGKREN